MERDFKHRAAPAKSARNSKKPGKRKPAARKTAKSRAEQPRVAVWRWALVFGIIALFGYFLYSLSLTEPQGKPKASVPPSVHSKQAGNKRVSKQIPVKKAPAKAKPVKAPKPKDKIQYDFYTVLPEAEFVIPEHEVKTRKREERVGKAKSGVKYSVQAGAFRHYKDADSLKAKLLMMGFSPKIEKAVVGSVTWYRVKMGPYNRLASVDAIQSRLKSKNMDALVIEVKK